MLTIEIPAGRFWNEKTESFEYVTEPTLLTLEHNLLSISRWESKWKKFCLKTFESKNIGRMTDKEFTELFIDYVRCMTVSTQGDPGAYKYISQDAVVSIVEYMNDPMSATTIRSTEEPKWREPILSAEYIYALMALNNIPFSCEEWHINKLLKLIATIQALQNPDKKKRSQMDIAADYAKINAERTARLKAEKEKKKAKKG